jgi:ADP-ribose pyrophosphatase YjhB (NUDIX family)
LSEPSESGRYPQASTCNFVYWPARDEILLIKKLPHKFDGGKWGCTGGKQEYGETTEQAAWREGAEEAGPAFNRLGLLYLGIVGVCEDYVPEIGKHYVTIIHGFEVRRGLQPEMINVEPEHHEAVDWFSLQGLPANITVGFSKVIAVLTNEHKPRPLHPDVTDRPWRFADREF